MQTEILFAAFKKEHIRDAVLLSQAASWPHRREDWEFALDLSQGMIGLEDNKVIATALASPFGAVATVNMIIVDKDRRGHGLGRKIMSKAMDTVNPKEWRLVATLAGLPLYQSAGFEAYDEVVQCQGVVSAPGGSEAIAEQAGDGLVWAKKSDAEDLAALDHDANGMERLNLVQRLFDVGKVLAIKENGTSVAWAALRPFGRGHVVGPVIARSRPEAERLLSPLIRSCDGQFLRVDTTRSADLRDWLAGFGLSHVDGGVAMRKGPSQRRVTVHQAYALVSQALG